MKINAYYLISVSMMALAPGLSAPAGAQVTASVAEEDSGHITDIVVTARKRSESAQNIPVTVAAVGGEALRRSGIKDLVQAVTKVPGVVFGRAPDDGLALTFRGLGTVARSQAFELSQAMFVDGVFMGKGRLYTTTVFDLDRLEFIKGTQSTLLGKNASLGAVSIVNRQPGDTASIEARAGYEFENGGYTGDVAGDLPLGEKAALRIAAHYNDFDGQIRNRATGNKVPIQKDLGLRATVKLEPTERLKLTGSYQFTNNRRIGVNYHIIGNVPAIYGEGTLNGDIAQFTRATADGDTHHRTRAHIASLKGELDLGSHVLVAQTAYVRYKLGFVDDFDFSTDEAVNFLRNEKYRQFTQELRIQSPSGQPLEYMAGLFYLDSRWNSLERQQWMVPAFPPPPAPTSGQLFNGPFANLYIQDSTSLSGFAAATWRIDPALRLSGGIRLTRETKDVRFGRTASAPFTIWNTIANPPFDPTDLDHNATFLDGNLSLQYDVARDVMLFVSYGHGSKSGGFAETNTVAVPPPLLVGGKVPAALVRAGTEVNNEFATTYEAGIKSTLLDRRLRLNVAGFWTRVKDFQDTVFTGGTLGFITFTGPARSRGFEIETSFQASPAIRIDAGMTYADATGIIQPIDPTTSAPQVDGSGKAVFARFRRSQAPKIVANAGIAYETAITDALDLSLGASLRHRSMIYNQRQEQFPSKALTTVDLTAGLASESGWGLDLQVRNAFNRIAQDFASPSVDPRFGAFYGAYLAGPSPSRTILLSARVKD